MKKLLLIVLAGFFVGPLTAFASGVFSNAPAVRQSYQQAGSTAVTSEQSQLSKVKAIMAAAKHEVAQQVPTGAQNNEPANMAQTVSSDTAVDSQVAVTSTTNKAGVQAQISQLNQANLLFQQQTDQRLEQLAAKNTDLTARLARMTQALMLINQELNTLNQQINKTGGKTQLSATARLVSLPAKAGNEIQRIEAKYGGVLKYILYAFIIVLLVFIALFIPRRRQIAKLKTEVSAGASVMANDATLPTNNDDLDDDTKSEFDYMSTREATPAKLDLARAYIEMEDYTQARQVLGQVLVAGDSEQQQQAQQLLSTIPQS